MLLTKETTCDIITEYKQEINNEATMCVCGACGVIGPRIDDIKRNIFDLNITKMQAKIEKRIDINDYIVTEKKLIKDKYKQLRHIVNIPYRTIKRQHRRRKVKRKYKNFHLVKIKQLMIYKDVNIQRCTKT